VDGDRKGHLPDDDRRVKDVLLVFRSARAVFDSRWAYVVGRL
jgi:hypothetical protein